MPGRASAPEGHRLVLIGDGPHRPRIAPGAEIEILGWRSDVADVLRAADSLVVASRGEGFSLALIEALAVGVAVFTTDVGGCEVLRPQDGAVCGSVADVVAAATGAVLPEPDEVRAERSAHHRLSVERRGRPGVRAVPEPVPAVGRSSSRQQLRAPTR